MATLFTRIVKGEVPCYKIAEDENYFAFLDIRPINPGHTLVIPKKEVDYFFDLEDETLSGLMVFAKKVSKMIEKVVECERIGVMVAGLEVPHVHIHLVPISSISDLSFAKAKPASKDALAKLAENIRKNG